MKPWLEQNAETAVPWKRGLSDLSLGYLLGVPVPVPNMAARPPHDGTVFIEEWRPVVGYVGYWVSTWGRVFSEWTRSPARASQNTTERWVVGLWTPRGKKSQQVHRLVAEAFLLGPRGPMVRHLDGNHHNNYVGNLQYGTHAENMEDAKRHGTMNGSRRQGGRFLTEQEVREIRASTERIVDLAERYQVSGSTISRVRNRKAWGWIA